MTIGNIWDTIRNNPGWITIIIVLIFSLIEISKIKINPWSAIGRTIGKFLGVKEVKDKVDAVEKKVDKLEEKVNEVENTVNENEAITARARILRFSSEVQDGIYHDKGLWDHIMADIAKYEKYVAEHEDFKNGITEPTNEYLTEQYKERLRKRDWDKKK